MNNFKKLVSRLENDGWLIADCMPYARLALLFKHCRERSKFLTVFKNKQVIGNELYLAKRDN